MTLIEQIGTYLQTNSVGTLGTSLFLGYMPATGTEVTAILDTGGTTPDPYLPTKSPTIQIYTRSATYTTGKARMDAIRTLLHNKYNLYLVSNQTYIYSINLQSESNHIGRNAQGQDEFSANYSILTR